MAARISGTEPLALARAWGNSSCWLGAQSNSLRYQPRGPEFGRERQPAASSGFTRAESLSYRHRRDVTQAVSLRRKLTVCVTSLAVLSSAVRDRPLRAAVSLGLNLYPIATAASPGAPRI
jgi:hypothetical protein